MTHEQAPWMIYGATGYTGELTAREAVRRGQRPVLAGRNRDKVEKLGHELGCPTRAFGLDSADAIAGQLRDIAVVLHCAGPFSATAAPMMDACLAACVSYLDITGEIAVIEAGAERDGRARAAGITLMPAVGFDVVPSDCLAATLAAALPGATQLELAFHASGGFSRGTAKTMVENLHRGGCIRRDGQLTPVPTAWQSLDVPYRSGKRTCVSIPWGDVASAYYTTGIGNIVVYTSMSPARIRQTRFVRPLLGVTRWAVIQRFLKDMIDRGEPGPAQEERENSRASLWGRAADFDGRQVTATLETLGGYPLTVLTSLAVVDKVLAGLGPKGFSTPARAFGADFICSFPHTELQVESAAPAAATT
ncbi:MAG: trans-acting enoyl reductase family protein [Pirellulales bacterium]